MLQLRYLLPRLIILGTLCLGIWVSSNTLARWAVKKYGDETLGSEIEADGIELSLTEGKLDFEQFQLESKNPSGAILTSDNLSLQLSVSDLLKRRLNVEHAVLTNPTVKRKSVDQKTIGDLLKESLAAGTITNQWPEEKQGDQSNWLQDLNQKLASISHDQAALERYSSQLKANWQREIQSCRVKADSLHKEIVHLQQSSQTDVNPLRLNAHRMQLTKKVTAVNDQIMRLNHHIAVLKRQADNEVAVLEKSKKQKQSQFDSIATKEVFSQRDLDQKLYRSLPRHEIESMVAWVDWVLMTVPTIETTAEEIQGRDTKLAEHQVSSLLIKKLELHGLTNVNNQFFRLLGNIQNITDAQNMEAGPTTLELRAQGDSHVMVSAIFDRQTGKKVISVKIPASDQEQMDVENLAVEGSKKINLEISPSRVFADLQVVIEGDKVSGSLTYQHTSAEMKVLAKGLEKTFQERLDENLSLVQGFNRTFRFAGSLDKLNVVHKSTLGPQLALGFNDAVEAYVSEVGNDRLEQAVALIDKESVSLKKLFDADTNDVLRSVQSGRQKVANLMQTPQAPNSSLRRLR